MKVITEDFQILRDNNEFEFNPGINIIVGCNGSGKSSLFYAVENCLSNPNGVDDCINHDSSSARVTIENNGQSITWIREKGSSSYINNLDGNTYVKASKLNSTNLADLGFYFDKKNRIMNIHNEWSTLFPFGESDTDMFRLFEDIFNISCSFEILDNIRKDEQELKSKIKQLKIEKEQKTERLNTLNEISSKVNLIDISNLISSLEDIISSKEALKQDYVEYCTNYPVCNIVLPKGFDYSVLYDCQYKLDIMKQELIDYKKSCVDRDITLSLESKQFEIKEPDDLKEVLKTYQELQNTIKQNMYAMRELNLQKADIEEELAKISVCPTCGRPL